MTYDKIDFPEKHSSLLAKTGNQYLIGVGQASALNFQMVQTCYAKVLVVNNNINQFRSILSVKHFFQYCKNAKHEVISIMPRSVYKLTRHSFLAFFFIVKSVFQLNQTFSSFISKKNIIFILWNFVNINFIKKLLHIIIKYAGRGKLFLIRGIYSL